MKVGLSWFFKSRVRKIAFVLVLGIFLSWLWQACLMDTDLNNCMTEEQIEAEVRASLPIGAPLSEVIKYFSKNKLGYSYEKHENEIWVRISEIKWVDIFGFTGRLFFISKDAFITIYLDQSGNVKEIEVRAPSTFI